jgi:putative ABC transport system substrate-binding protein
VIGFLSSLTAGDRPRVLIPFNRGLNEAGYADGRNVRIEYRFAEAQYERLPALAADLVHQQVTVIVAISGTPAALAAKAATATIPIVFVTGFDPVATGFVASLNRPGGNLTGVSFLVVFTVAKRLELLSELVPTAGIFGMLVNPNNPNAESTIQDAQGAAEKLGKKLVVVRAGTERDLDTSFETFIRQKVEAVLVETDPFFLARREQIVALTARHSLPAIFAFREFVAVGGLMSYGTSLSNAYHQAAVYAGKILKGEKPADLPV